MKDSVFISKKELIAELGICRSTFNKRCRAIGIEKDMRKLIPREKANEIKLALISAALVAKPTI